jgi:hypothetical protein
MDEKLKKLAINFARMYLHIAKSVGDRFGQQGIETIKLGLRKYALERGQNIRRDVDRLDLPPNMENYYKNFDSSLADAGFEIDLQLSGWTAEGEVRRCPFAEIWKDMGAPEIGLLYCQVDHDMLEGYNPDLKLDQPLNLLKGDRSCRFQWRKKEKSDE